MAGQVPFAFGDGKDPDAFRTIGEVAKAFGLRQHVLRYWEEQFPMLSPLKRAGGRRYYRAEDVALVGQIAGLLNDEGFTIRGARLVLEGGARDAAERVSAVSEPAAPQPAATGGNIDPSLHLRIGAVRQSLARALEQA